MANPYDQFDQPEAANPYDQFDQPDQQTGAANPYDQFDAPAEQQGEPDGGVSVEVEDDSGILNTAWDMIKSVPGGAVDAVENTGDLATSLAQEAGLPVGLRYDDDGLSVVWDKAELDDAVFGKHGETDNIGPESETTAGRLTRGVSQFVTSFIGAGKFLAPAKGLVGTGKAATVGKAMTQGAVADFTGFNPNEDRLSDFVNNQFPELSSPVTEYLAADPEDSEAEGRFKNALEGMLIGGAADAFFRTVKGLRNARKAASKAEAEQVIADTADDVLKNPPKQQADQGDLFAVETGEAAEAGVDGAARGEANTSGFQVTDSNENGFVLSPEGYKTSFDTKDQDFAGLAANRDTIVDENGNDLDVLSVRFSQLPEELQGKGVGFRMYEEAAREAARRGIPLASDVNVSEAAERIWAKFKKEGYAVREIPTEDTKPMRLLEPQAVLDKTGEVTKANRKTQGIKPQERELVDSHAMGQKLELKRDPNGVSMEPDNDWFNWDKMDGPDGAKDVIKLTANAVQGRLDELVQSGTYSFQQMARDAGEELADTVDMGFDRLVTNTAKLAQSQKDMAANFLAGKMAVQSIGRKVYDLAEKIDNGMGTDADMLRYASLIQKQGELVANIKAIQTTSARVTASGRISTKDALTDEQLAGASLADELSRAGGPEAVRAHAKRMRAVGRDNTKGQVALNRSSGWRRMADVNAEVFINSILSGPKTHLLNMTSNAIQSVILPMEKMVGGMAGMDRQMFMEGTRQMMYMREAFRESIKMAGKSGWNEANLLDPGVSTVDAPKFAIHSDSDGPVGGFIRMVGKGIRIPSRFLGAEDEFFKQMNYRSALKATLHTQAIQKFPKDASKRAEWIETEFKKGFDANGKAINEEALAYTREATFTTPLKDTPTASGGDSFGRWVERGVNGFPPMRIILPFVRTPTNILRQAWARTPGLNMLQTEFRRDLLSGDPRRASRAKGKLMTGATMYGYAGMLAMEGRITGGGPADYKERQRLMETGWQPYSFVTTGDDGKKVYTSYKRLDPYATFLQVAADATHLMNNLDETERDGLGIALTVALSRSLQEKSYLTGLTDLLAAFDQPDRKAQKYFQNLTSAYVPTGLKQVSEGVGITDDPYMREANNVLQAMMKKVPGLSDELAPKTSWVTGEGVKYPEGFLYPDKISPFTQTRDKGSIVLQELAELQHGFTAPSSTFGNIDIKEDMPEAWTRYQKLHATATLGGMTMQERLRRHFESSRYNRDAEQALLEDGATTRTSQIITKYRSRAKKELMREFPELREEERSQDRTRGDARRGNPDAIQQLLDLNNQ